MWRKEFKAGDLYYENSDFLHSQKFPNLSAILTFAVILSGCSNNYGSATASNHRLGDSCFHVKPLQPPPLVYPCQSAVMADPRHDIQSILAALGRFLQLGMIAADANEL